VVASHPQDAVPFALVTQVDPAEQAPQFKKLPQPSGWFPHEAPISGHVRLTQVQLPLTHSVPGAHGVVQSMA
jgi:hypothetical protein